MAVHKKFGNMGKTGALGRGLDALISTGEVKTGGSSTISEVALADIEPNPHQPRHDFDTEALEELAASIREIGIIQPITLRQMTGGKYQIIAGERRWRASQQAGLTTIPAYIRTTSDEQVMEMALVENIQREDLNAIEIALAYEHLLEENGMTQEKISERVGKSRTAVANHLRLLKLPAQVQMALQRRTIDMGHARALLSLDDPAQQIKLFREIEKKGYSVRRVEEAVRQMRTADADGTGQRGDSTRESMLTEKIAGYQQRLGKATGVRVALTCSAKGKGRISIPFASEEELERIATMLEGRALSVES